MLLFLIVFFQTAPNFPLPGLSQSRPLTLFTAVVAAVGRLSATRWPRRPRRPHRDVVVLISVPGDLQISNGQLKNIFSFLLVFSWCTSDQSASARLSPRKTGHTNMCVCVCFYIQCRDVYIYIKYILYDAQMQKKKGFHYAFLI